ncbi:hypothetical protein HOD29_04190 [archaeon]|jgi:hypothetical protein|nr:hypothetical protein [archaeon]
MKVLSKMSQIRDLSELENKYSFLRKNNFIDGGTEGSVFLINGFAGKIVCTGLKLGDTVWSANKLIDEYNIGVNLYNHGISVPKPKGVFLVDHLRSSYSKEISERNPAFLMEYLEGYKKIHTLGEKSGDRARELKYKEFAKFGRVDWFPHDFDHDENLMYSEEKDDLKILDFGRYERR